MAFELRGQLPQDSPEVFDSMNLDPVRAWPGNVSPPHVDTLDFPSSVVDLILPLFSEYERPLLWECIGIFDPSSS